VSCLGILGDYWGSQPYVGYYSFTKKRDFFA